MSDSQANVAGGGALELSIESKRLEGNIGLITITGEVDVYTSPRVRSAMLEHLDNGCTSLIVDLSAVDYLDSSGLGTLVAGLKRSKEHGGQVILVSPKPRIVRVLEVTGLDQVFSILASVEEAVRAAGRN